MAHKWEHSYERFDSAFDVSDDRVCMLPIRYPHRLVSAALWTCETTLVGTAVVVQLRCARPGDARAGRLVGTALNNDDLGGTAVGISAWTEVPFSLGGNDMAWTGMPCIYYLALASDNSSDRIYDPLLILKVNDSA